MRKSIILFVIIAFTALCLNVFGQPSYSFEYIKSGQGKQSILFIPGFACSGQVWNDTRIAFEKNFTCYTLTMAGFAGTKPQPSPRFAEWANSIAKFIHDQHIEKPILVGHSMGGVLAMSVAANNPGLIDRIVVVDALPCLSAMMNPDFKSNPNNDCTEMITQITSATEDQFYQMQQKSIAMLMADTSRREKVVEWSMKTDRKTFGEMYCDFSNTDMRDRIATITCPALILLESYFINFKPTIESQYSKLSKANLQYADKGLHFIMFDDPEWYMNQLTAFIRP